MAEIRVLVVDDDEDMRELMLRRISRMGLQADQAADFPTAIQLIEHKPYDLILTDIYMPGGSGLDILRHAKEADPHVQVVLVTGSATFENAVEALNVGAFNFLTKPFDHVGVFDNAVTRALEFRRLIRDNQRLAQIQRRRGDMLEAEVTDRIRQMRRKQQDMIDLLARLPLAVVVVDEEGRVLLSNALAEKWLAEDARLDGQPLRSYLSPGPAPRTTAELRLGRLTLQATPRSMAPVEGKARTLVMLERRVEGERSERSDLVELIGKIKPGLEWLSQQKLEGRGAEVVNLLSAQLANLEEVVTGEATGARPSVVAAVRPAAPRPQPAEVKAVGPLPEAAPQVVSEPAAAAVQPASAIEVAPEETRILEPAASTGRTPRRGLLRSVKARQAAERAGKPLEEPAEAAPVAEPAKDVDLSDIFGKPPIAPEPAEEALAAVFPETESKGEEPPDAGAASEPSGKRRPRQWPPPLPSRGAGK